jgi:hypothetical protein
LKNESAKKDALEIQGVFGGGSFLTEREGDYLGVVATPTGY